MTTSSETQGRGDDVASWVYGAGLFPQHADLLRASRIPPERATGRYVSVDTKSRLDNLGLSSAAQRVPGLLVRLLDARGETVGVQYRPDDPRTGANGKAIKYETPTGQSNRIDVPSGVGPLLGDPGIRLWITEGSRKADAAAELGLACVSISGVWAWRGKNATGGKTAIPDFDDIALNGREVVLAFDSDVMVKPSVRNALDRLSRYLEGRGANAHYLLLPHTADGKTGLDDWIAAGGTREQLEELVRNQLPGTPAGTGRDEDEPRRLIATPASQIKPRRVRWLWDGRIPVGALSVIAGRECLGKSTFAFDLAARVTRGELHGEFLGVPRPVLMMVTEDSWDEAVVPRLMAAGADLDMVHSVEVKSEMGFGMAPTFPADLMSLADLTESIDPAMTLLDPLISRLSSKLDSHKDGEVRQALEPLTGLAHKTGVAIVGIMHFNKSATDDPLNALMGSRAFGAIARSVSVVIRHPDDPERRVFGTPKNNLGPDTLPPIGYRIVGHQYEVDGEMAWTSRVERLGSEPESISELMSRSKSRGQHTATSPAETWLRQQLGDGEQPKRQVLAAGLDAGFAKSQVERAAAALGVASRRLPGFQGGTAWSLPGSASALKGRHGVPQLSVVPQGDAANEMNAANAANEEAVQAHSSHTPHSTQSPDTPPGTTPLWQDPPTQAVEPAPQAANHEPPPASRLPRTAPGKPFRDGRMVPKCRHDGCRSPRLLGGILCQDHLGQPLSVST